MVETPGSHREIDRGFLRRIQRTGPWFSGECPRGSPGDRTGPVRVEVERPVPIAVWFRRRRIGDFRADMLIEGKVLLELKAARTIDQAHERQLLNYLRATDVEVGLLLNFAVRPEFRRLVYENE